MTMKTRYTVVDGEVIAEKRSGVRKQYVPDPLGSTVALLDNTQTQTDTFTYWPYGEEVSRTGTTPASFRFVGTLGYYRDSSTKTYVRARELDTQKGRWLTQDPIWFNGGDWNIFRYASNNPITFNDILGLQTNAPCSSPCVPPVMYLFCSYCCVVIGEGTPDVYQTGSDCNCEVWDGNSLIGKQSNSIFPPYPPDELERRDREWMNGVMDRGCVIVDIGPRGKKPVSRYYKAELEEIRKRNYKCHIGTKRRKARDPIIMV